MNLGKRRKSPCVMESINTTQIRSNLCLHGRSCFQSTPSLHKWQCSHTCALLPYSMCYWQIIIVWSMCLLNYSLFLDLDFLQILAELQLVPWFGLFTKFSFLKRVVVQLFLHFFSPPLLWFSPLLSHMTYISGLMNVCNITPPLLSSRMCIYLCDSE